MHISIMKFLAITLLLSLTACSTVRQVNNFDSANPNGKTAVVDNDEVLAYTIAVEIEAPKERIWSILTDAKRFSTWNSTIISMEGEIKSEGEIALVSTVAPERTFELTVSEFQPNTRMVWEDGMPFGFFTGVRTFALTDTAKGTTKVTISEALSGGMLGMIKEDLPDFTESFEAFAQDLKAEAEKNQ